jgi:hypothetical protein
VVGCDATDAKAIYLEADLGEGLGVGLDDGSKVGSDGLGATEAKAM